MNRKYLLEFEFVHFSPLVTVLFVFLGLPVFSGVHWGKGSAVFAEEKSIVQSKEIAAKVEFFEKKVRPVLVEHCQKCHGPEKQEGEFRIDSRSSILRGGETGPAINLESPAESELLLAINYDPDGYQMPPDKKLSPEEIGAITKWIQEGAIWPKSETVDQVGQSSKFVLRTDHWSLQPIIRPAVPDVKQGDWPRSPIDRFILAKLEKAGLKPSGPANRSVLARRLYFDLIGLPPTPEQLDQFLNDSAPDAYEQLVERLLASPHYGERWARHWLDLVRYAETYGHEFDYEISHTFHYRDYVIRAFNEDIPFDQFALEHFAGDLLEHPRYRADVDENESVLATGFFWMGQGKHSPVDIRAEQCDLIDNQIDVLSKAFLGTSVACARCHDHKFDPISIKDYYALSGVMESSRRHYADIRRQEPLNETIRQIHRLKKEYRAALIEFSAGQLQQFLNELMRDDALVDWEAPELNRPEHPLYIWKQFRSLNDAKEISLKKNQIQSQLQKRKLQQSKADKQSVVYAGFAHGLPAGWSRYGQAFLQPEHSGETLITSPDPWKPVLAVHGNNTLHSGTASGRSYGVLRSPTFIIDKPFIDYHLCRSSGNRLTIKRHRGQLNRGQINLIIDGFQLIKDPIYGGLSLQIPVADQPRWVRQNVQKWIGHRAYIEIYDEEEGFVQIDQIRFSDDQHQTERPLPALTAMLEQDRIRSLSDLKNHYRLLFQQAIDQYRACKDDSASLDRQQRTLINWMLKQLKQSGMKTERPEWLDRFYLQLKELESKLGKPNLALATTEGSGLNSPHLIRGNPKKPAEEIPRRFLGIFGGKKEAIPQHSSGRLEIARSIVSKQNPLFDRVIVNRIWEHHFGRGLVATPDDFGKMGIPPSHPKLLDYLASEFRSHHRSIKWLHRALLNTSTYRMSSKLREDALEKDPQNRLWHRMPVRRLEGEAIRDAMLTVSGRLNPQMYGPSIPPYLTPFMLGRGRPPVSGPLDGNGRRSIYINVRRNFLTPLFLAFDYPLPTSTTGQRSVSNVPAQALTLLNNQFAVQQAHHWAVSLLGGKKGSPEKLIQRIYLQAFSREPTQPEIDKITRFVKDELQTGRSEIDVWSDVCHIMFNVKEFVFIR